MGEVHLARFEGVGKVRRLVAIKFLIDVPDQDPAKLLLEARLTALVTHPNIVQILDAGVDHGRAWFAMEFVPGLSLSEMLKLASGPLPPWVGARIVSDLALAVHALHEAKDERGRRLDIIHRDVTPHNALVSWDGVVKLLDLGIARSRLRSTTTTTGVVRGKLGYMSPEQAGGEAIDRRSDIFGLGVLLWEALAGRRLFEGNTDNELLARVIRGDVPALIAVAAHVPPSLAELTHRALARDPAARFATALEMHRALEVALRASGIIVGHHEVAHALAVFAPGRVDEHQAWLSEVESNRDGQVVPAPLRGPSATPSLAAQMSASFTPPIAGARDSGAARGGRPRGLARFKSRAVRRVMSGGALASLTVIIVLTLRAARAPLARDSIPEKASAVAPTGPPEGATTVSAPLEPPPAAQQPAATVQREVAPAATVLPRAASASAPAGDAGAGGHLLRKAAQAPPPIAATTMPVASVPPVSPVNCTPPFYFDDHGNRVFKKECL
jgi:eukaryotic-like serine/threonine-protein kinase